MGGGMRQAGYLAAAGIFALDNHISRLKEDHKNAAQLAAALAECSFVKSIKPVFTNIVIFELDNSMAGDLFVQKLKEKGILVSAFAPYTVRMVTHLDVSKEMIDQVCHTLKRF